MYMWAQRQLNESMDTPSVHSSPFRALDKELQELLMSLDFAPTTLDLIVERNQKPVAELLPKLLTLELEGWVCSVVGGYQRQK